MARRRPTRRADQARGPVRQHAGVRATLAAGPRRTPRTRPQLIASVPTPRWELRFLERALERRRLLAVVVGVDNGFLDDLVEFGVAPFHPTTLRRIAPALGPDSTQSIVARFRIQWPSRCKRVPTAMPPLTASGAPPRETPDVLVHRAPRHVRRQVDHGVQQNGRLLPGL